MKVKAIIQYVDYRLRLNMQNDVYQLISTDLLYIEANKFRQETIGKDFIFREKYNKIWGVEVKEDTRTREQIIEDTFAKRGIKIIRGV